MDAFIDLLSGYGYIGFFIAAFIAGSVFPFSSEAVMIALIAAGLDPVQLVIYGTVGNVLGSMFNYGVGRLGKPEWISKYLHVKEDKLRKTEKFLAGRGAWMGVLTFLPILGSAISVALGLMRANVVITTISVFLGKSIRYIILMLGTTALVGCSTATYHEKPLITVSIEPLRYFTEGVAGDKFDVCTMLPKGISPETYEPTGNQMVSLSNSNIYIMVGRLGFETTWMKRFKNTAPHMTVVNASDGIEEYNDPHVWTSVNNAQVILKNITRALIQADKKDSLYFINRCDSMSRKLTELDGRIRRMVSSSADKTFVVYHPTLTYFAKDYGLTQIPVERDGKEPSAGDMKNIINTAKASNVHTILLQKEFTGHNTEALSEAIDARVRVINPLAYDWQEEMENIAKAICNR